MNPYKNENSLKKLSNSNKSSLKKILLFNSKLIHKVFDSINISLLIFIFILSFISFNSQRKWTNIYNNIAKTRSNNNNLVDYISKTEQFYINEIESLNTFKKTKPKDLIYIVKQFTQKEQNLLEKKIRFIHYGLKDSIYQRGY